MKIKIKKRKEKEVVFKMKYGKFYMVDCQSITIPLLYLVLGQTHIDEQHVAEENETVKK